MNKLKRICARTSCVSILVAVALLGTQNATANSETETASENPASSIQRLPADAGQDNRQNPTLKQNPLEELRKLEPPLDEEYTLGPGDEISIEIAGRPELSSKDVIGPDGRMTLPVVGAVKIADLTREEAGKKIVEAMGRYYTMMSATVKVEKYGSNHIVLLGNVKNPGIVNFDQAPTLLEALSKGGFETRADGNVPSQCVIYRKDKVYWVELQELLETGSPLADLRLRRNDVVFVPALSTRTVTVMGAVQHPGQVSLRHDSTLSSVLGEVGGINDNAGGNPEIQVVHHSKGDKTQYVRFNDLLKPNGGMEISLYPGDILYVPKSGLAKVGFLAQQLAPFVTMGSFAVLAAH